MLSSKCYSYMRAFGSRNSGTIAQVEAPLSTIRKFSSGDSAKSPDDIPNYMDIILSEQDAISKTPPKNVNLSLPGQPIAPVVPPPKKEEPFSRAARLLKEEVRGLWQRPTFHRVFPNHCDVCIIGGGAMGASIAYWLKLRGGQGLDVVVLERDSSYHLASTAQSVGGMRMQYSLAENIQMSMFSAQFLRNAGRLLAVEGEPAPDMFFHPHGYLMCASPEGADQLQTNYRFQVENGARLELMTPERLAARFPWISTDGVALACHGRESEGWFDPQAMLRALRTKSVDLGAIYVEGEAAAFELSSRHNGGELRPGEHSKLDSVIARVSDGTVQRVSAAIFVLAAGASSGRIARLAGIGGGDGLLEYALPVEPRKRYVYHVHAPDGPTLNCPLVVDPCGLYFRREGLDEHYICGKSPTGAEDDPEPSTDDLDVDLAYFDSHLWPALAARAPGFERLKVKSSWAGFYDYNTLDQNAIIGPHPYHGNLVLATGFSGHGVQQAPAVGRAVAELVFEGSYRTIDLTRLSFERVLMDEPVKEQYIV